MFIFHNGGGFMTDKAPPAEKSLSLSDADIGSQPAVTRRSLLGALGVSAGVAAAVAFGTAESVRAADSDQSSDKTKGKKKKAPPKEEADSD
jgi:hypothetical protein